MIEDNDIAKKLAVLGHPLRLPITRLHVSPKLIPASFLPHLLFGLFLWGLDTYLPRNGNKAA